MRAGKESKMRAGFLTAVFVVAVYVFTTAILNAAFALGALQERVTLATPIVPTATITDYQVRSLNLDIGDRTTVEDDNIVVVLEATTGAPTDPLHMQRFVYTGQVANNMITALNKANLTTRSLNQRILDRLVADGLIAGAVTGTVP
jgi:hypothetical protein